MVWLVEFVYFQWRYSYFRFRFHFHSYLTYYRRQREPLHLTTFGLFCRYCCRFYWLVIFFSLSICYVWLNWIRERISACDESNPSTARNSKKWKENHNEQIKTNWNREARVCETKYDLFSGHKMKQFRK